MTEQETKNEKMQVLYAFEEANKELHARRAQAARIADDLLEIADRLRHDPERLYFNGDAVPVEFADTHAPNVGSLDAAKVREICAAIRELSIRVVNLEERKKLLGYK